MDVYLCVSKKKIGGGGYFGQNRYMVGERGEGNRFYCANTLPDIRKGIYGGGISRLRNIYGREKGGEGTLL